MADATLESDATLKDYDTVAAITAVSLEVGNTGYGRAEWDNADLAAYTVDDTLDRIVLALPSVTFTTVLAGDYWRKFIIAYDPDTTSGTDANLIPVKAFDLLNANNTAIIPDGGDILCAWPNGFHISS